MSVQSEINRIKGNVTAALAKIAEKGVTVPDGANSDNLEALIESSEAGGGGVQLQYNRLYPAATGTFTPAARTLFNTDAPLVIEHNAGIIPFVVLVTSNGMDAAGDLEFIASWIIPHYNVSYYDKNRLYSLSSRRGSSSSQRNTKYGTYSGGFPSWDMGKVAVAQDGSGIYVNAGKTYTWTVYGIE